MNKICTISTIAGTAKSFMLGNLNHLAENGYDCYCICNTTDQLTPEILGRVKYIPVKIEWGFASLFSAMKTIYHLYKIFKREKFDIIQYATSNAALVGSIAGWLAGVPIRIYLQWGVSYPVYTGFQRFVRKKLLKLTIRLSTNVQPDSKSNLKFCIEEGLYPAGKGSVIYNGSACGADLQKFDISKKEGWKKEVLEELNIKEYHRIFGFVGRIVKEKGIGELIAAFKNMNDDKSYLVLVGPMDENHRIDPELMTWAELQPNVIFTGPKSNPAKYFASFDFMMLPSYQEGFGMTVVESSAMGVPSIITDIKGPTDLIADDKNGLVCKVKSVESLLSTMRKASEMTEEEYASLSHAAYQEAKDKFDSVEYKKHFLENRDALLRSKGLLDKKCNTNSK